MPWVGLRQESDNIWIRTGSCVVLNRRVCQEVGNARLARSCRALLSYLPIYPFRSGYQGDSESPESTFRTFFVMYEQFLNFYRKVVIDGHCRGECSPIPGVHINTVSLLSALVNTRRRILRLPSIFLIKNDSGSHLKIHVSTPAFGSGVGPESSPL